MKSNSTQAQKARRKKQRRPRGWTAAVERRHKLLVQLHNGILDLSAVAEELGRASETIRVSVRDLIDLEVKQR